MTAKEVQEVIGILLQADGECYICAAYLCGAFIEEFKEWEAETISAYNTKFNESYEEVFKEL